MMMRAQQDEVTKARFAAVDPMLHVMRLYVSRAVAAREHAVPITREQRASQRRRNDALFATDI
jgi:hypothetical protein